MSALGEGRKSRSRRALATLSLRFAGMLLLSGCWVSPAFTQPAGMATPASATDALAKEEFTEEDFAQFFGLIVDGKIAREKMSTRCAKEIVGFTFEGRDLLHEDGLVRIDYNQTKQARSVDGRALRSKHFNTSLGEWSGAVYKPLCPGLYAIAVDFATGDAGRGAAEDVWVHLYLRRRAEARPGTRIVSGLKTGRGAAGSGHLTLSLPLRTGDEVSTWSEGADGKKRLLRQITFTAWKMGHLEKYVEELDVEAFNRELPGLKDAKPPAK
jgi:hypothetical protein